VRSAGQSCHLSRQTNVSVHILGAVVAANLLLSIHPTGNDRQQYVPRPHHGVSEQVCCADLTFPQWEQAGSNEWRALRQEEHSSNSVVLHIGHV